MTTPKISGVILAGGLGRRMGGVDKGLQRLDDKPMVQWVLERFAPQVDEVWINANQNAERYAAFGYPLLPDQIQGFAGPLAGLHAALSQATHPLVASVPCDSPFLPNDLVARLVAALETQSVASTPSALSAPQCSPQMPQLAVARTFAQPHPVFCVCRRTVLPHLTAFLASGNRRFEHWYATLNTVEVAFDDEAEAFSNINTRDELEKWSRGSALDR
jgi:molybdopterin-guanine dinucleotide biosynthesis protein A